MANNRNIPAQPSFNPPDEWTIHENRITQIGMELGSAKTDSEDLVRRMVGHPQFGDDAIEGQIRVAGTSLGDIPARRTELQTLVTDFQAAFDAPAGTLRHQAEQLFNELRNLPAKPTGTPSGPQYAPTGTLMPAPAASSLIIPNPVLQESQNRRTTLGTQATEVRTILRPIQDRLDRIRRAQHELDALEIELRDAKTSNAAQLSGEVSNLLLKQRDAVNNKQDRKGLAKFLRGYQNRGLIARMAIGASAAAIAAVPGGIPVAAALRVLGGMAGGALGGDAAGLKRVEKNANSSVREIIFDVNALRNTNRGSPRNPDELNRDTDGLMRGLENQNVVSDLRDTLGRFSAIMAHGGATVDQAIAQAHAAFPNSDRVLIEQAARHFDAQVNAQAAANPGAPVDVPSILNTTVNEFSTFYLRQLSAIVTDYLGSASGDATEQETRLAKVHKARAEYLYMAKAQGLSLGAAPALAEQERIDRSVASGPRLLRVVDDLRKRTEASRGGKWKWGLGIGVATAVMGAGLVAAGTLLMPAVPAIAVAAKVAAPILSSATSFLANRPREFQRKYSNSSVAYEALDQGLVAFTRIDPSRADLVMAQADKSKMDAYDKQSIDTRKKGAAVGALASLAVMQAFQFGAHSVGMHEPEAPKTSTESPGLPTEESLGMPHPEASRIPDTYSASSRGSTGFPEGQAEHLGIARPHASDLHQAIYKGSSHEDVQTASRHLAPTQVAIEEHKPSSIHLRDVDPKNASMPGYSPVESGKILHNEGKGAGENLAREVVKGYLKDHRPDLLDKFTEKDLDRAVAELRDDWVDKGIFKGSDYSLNLEEHPNLRAELFKPTSSLGINSIKEAHDVFEQIYKEGHNDAPLPSFDPSYHASSTIADSNISGGAGDGRATPEQIQQAVEAIRNGTGTSETGDIQLVTNGSPETHLAGTPTPPPPPSSSSSYSPAAERMQRILDPLHGVNTVVGGRVEMEHRLDEALAKVAQEEVNKGQVYDVKDLDRIRWMNDLVKNFAQEPPPGYADMQPWERLELLRSALKDPPTGFGARFSPKYQILQDTKFGDLVRVNQGNKNLLIDRIEAARGVYGSASGSNAMTAPGVGAAAVAGAGGALLLSRLFKKKKGGGHH